MKLKEKELTDPMALSNRLGNELCGNNVSYNTLLTALCYLIANIMVMAEHYDSRNDSTRVVKMISHAIDAAYKGFKESLRQADA